MVFGLVLAFIFFEFKVCVLGFMCYGLGFSVLCLRFRV